MSYAEYLKANGATEDDIKLLDTPVARKAHEKMEAQVAAAAEAQRKADDLVKRNQEWAAQVETQNQQYLKERDSAKIAAAAADARYAEMGRLGLIELAEKMEPGSTKTTTTDSSAPDPRYVTGETLLAVAEREGEGIATQADIIYEHYLLFGNDSSKKPDFRALRREAAQRKVSMEQVWMERYDVANVRNAQSAAAKAAEVKSIEEAAVIKWQAEHPASNPMLQPPTVSKTPFTGILPSQGTAGKQPWQMSDGEKGNARMNKVIGSLQEKGLVH